MARTADPRFFAARSATMTRAERLDRMDRIARLLDAAVSIPGTSIRFGADAVIGLLPFYGPALMAALSGWFVWEARRMGVPGSVLARMTANIVVEAAVDMVPVLGNVADVFFRANLRNAALVRRHFEGPRS